MVDRFTVVLDVFQTASWTVFVLCDCDLFHVTCLHRSSCLGGRVVDLFSDRNMWTWMSQTTVPSLTFFICKVIVAV